MRSGSKGPTGSPRPPARARRLGVLLGLAHLAGPRVAFAQASSAQAQGIVSVGFTDNPLNDPPKDATHPGPEPDGFLELQPGVVLRYDGPRTGHTLAYNFAYNTFFLHQNANSYSNALGYTGRFDLSPRAALTLGLSGTQGQTNTLARLGAAGGGELATVPGGAPQVFFLGAVTQNLGYELSENLRLLQAASFSFLQPIALEAGPPRAQVATGGVSFGLQRSWANDAGTLSLGTTGLFATAVDAAPAQKQIVTSLATGWIHQFSLFWQSELQGGLMQGFVADDPGKQFWEPTGLAAIRFQQDIGSARLSYSHAAQPLPLLGTSAITDDLSLQVALPIAWRSRLFLSASGGYRFTRLFTETGALAAPIHVLLGDAALVLTPVPALGVALRYQLLDQLPDAQPPELAARFPTLGYLRNTVMLSFSVSYPDPPSLAAPPPLVAPPFRPVPAGVSFTQSGAASGGGPAAGGP